ncbi:MAG: histidine phosphatase family protein [Planctomycetes bacterium]|nr:histidine phosphatase family protein [Planctomycetota bacterium]
MSRELRERIAARRRVYLMRHGDVSYFDALGRPYPSRAVPLNEEGIAQAEAAREALRGVAIDLAVDSGLPRARQTAEIVLRGRGVAVEACAALEEVRPGPFLKEASGPAFEAYFTGAFSRAIAREDTFLGGETFGSHADRVLPAFREIVERPGWKNLLIVAHGGTNRVILLHALGAGPERLGRIEQEPGCINVIDVHGAGEYLVRQVNFTPCDAAKERTWATTLEKIYLDHHEGAARARREGGG